MSEYFDYCLLSTGSSVDLRDYWLLSTFKPPVEVEVTPVTVIPKKTPSPDRGALP